MSAPITTTTINSPLKTLFIAICTFSIGVETQASLLRLCAATRTVKNLSLVLWLRVCEKTILPDFHARHPGESRDPARISDCFNAYQRQVLDSGLRRNDGLGSVYTLIHIL
jgi:hypothetical protein